MKSSCLLSLLQRDTSVHLTQAKHARTRGKINKAWERTVKPRPESRNLSTVISLLMPRANRWRRLRIRVKHTLSGCCGLGSGPFVRVHLNSSLPTPGRVLVYNNVFMMLFILQDRVAVKIGALKRSPQQAGKHPSHHPHSQRPDLTPTAFVTQAWVIFAFVFVYNTILQKQYRKKKKIWFKNRTEAAFRTDFVITPQMRSSKRYRSVAVSTQ